jgi:hypothetical protein
MGTFLLVVSFLVVLVACVVRPPTSDFREYVAKEAAKVALQLLGLTVVGALASGLVRDAQDRRDFAYRLRSAYGKAKSCRRRLKGPPAGDLSKELELLNDIQLEFENLRDEAEWRHGNRSPLVTQLTDMEEYLREVVRAGNANPRALQSGSDAFQDFIAHYNKESKFASRFKQPYHSIREQLR